MSGAFSSHVGCGDRVRERCGRHVGVVRAVISGTARVAWEDTGWVSDLPVGDLEIEERARRSVCRTVLTVVASPRRQLEAWMAAHPATEDER